MTQESRVAIYRRLIRSVNIQYHAIFFSCCCDIFEIRWRQFFCVNSLSKKCEVYTLEIKIRLYCYLLQFLHTLAIIYLNKGIIKFRCALFGLDHLIYNFLFFVKEMEVQGIVVEEPEKKRRKFSCGNCNFSTR